MDDLFKKIAEYLGYGAVSVAVLGALWKFFLKFLVEELIKFRVTKQQSIHKHDLDKQLSDHKNELDKQLRQFEFQSKAIFDAQDKYLTSKLELESVKLGRVFDHLEQINLLYTNYLINFNSFMNSVVNNNRLRENSENLRLEVDTQIIDHIHKVAIYIPEELRIILNQMRVIISNSWQDPQVLYRVHGSIGVNGKLVAETAIQILSSYHKVYLDMVRNYCSVKSEKFDYSGLLAKYGFNDRGEFQNTEILARYVKGCILFHEYTDSSKMIELQNSLEESVS